MKYESNNAKDKTSNTALHKVVVSISQNDDDSGRYYSVSIRIDGEKENKNAVWCRDYNQALTFAGQFLECERDFMCLSGVIQ